MSGPNDESRILVLGRTGSGKTVFSFFILATRNWTEIPWVVIDYKRDKLFSLLLKTFKGKVKEISATDKPPSKPGIYILRPMLKRDDDDVEAFLMACYEHENIGLYFDEGYSVPQRDAMDAILTQGRSKRIPVIILYQRPAWLTKFGKSQADYVAVFHLNYADDRRAVREFTGETLINGHIVNATTRLPKYYCFWYDVAEDIATVLEPAPKQEDIMKIFRKRLITTPSGRFL